MPTISKAIVDIKAMIDKSQGAADSLLYDLTSFSGVLNTMGDDIRGSVGSVSIDIKVPKAPSFAEPPAPVIFTPTPLKFSGMPDLVTAPDLPELVMDDMPTMDVVSDLPSLLLTGLPAMEDAGAVPTLTLAGLPSLLASGNIPELSLDAAPAKSFGESPRPVDDFAVAAPENVPVIVIPELPPSVTLTNPTREQLFTPYFPQFTKSAPVYTPTEPLPIEFFSELDRYVEPPPGIIEGLLADHRALLLDRVVSGGTGLPSAIEQAIWSRERDREASVMRSAEEDVLRQDSAMGFYTPSGTAQAKLYKVRADYSNKLIALGRDIAIKQADLELTNVMRALEQLIPIEQEMVKYDLAMRQRAFDAVKINNEALVQVFDITIKGYIAAQEIRKQGIQVFQARIQAYEGEIRAHTALLEAEKSKLSVNKDLIAQYIAEISANNMLLEAYKSSVSATVAIGELEGLKVKVFDAEVSAFNSQVQAHVAKIQGKSEETKAYSERVKAYQAEVQGYAAGIEAKTKEYGVLAEKIKLIQSTNMGTVEAYKAEVDAQTKEFSANAEKFKIVQGINQYTLEAYKAEVDANTKAFAADAERTKLTVEVNKGKVDAYTAGVDAKSKEFAAKAESFKLIQGVNQNTLEAYKAETGAISARSTAEIGFATVNNQSNASYSTAIASFNNVQAQVWGASAQAHISAQTVASQIAKMNLDAVQTSRALSLDASKTAAQTYAQLVSSILSQQHYTVGVSSSASLDANLSETHNLKE